MTGNFRLPSPNDIFYASIDPGLVNTGYAFWHDGKLISSGTIVSNNTVDYTRPATSARALIDKIESTKLKSGMSVSLIVIEDMQFTAGFFNSTTPEMIGVIKFWGMTYGVSLLSLNVSTIKKYITGSGRATKSKI